MDFAGWLDNIRFDLFEPILIALTAIVWVLAEYRIVKGGMQEYGDIAEGGKGQQLSKREAFIETLKTYAVGMIAVAFLAAIFAVMLSQLEEFTTIVADALEAAKP
ncbi:MAG: hypothetical protein A3A65_02830 [Candidatus Chisholmbacteria bacterium RIFCSPLOWO2_01_FULL_49_14]|uniref:Uncharacterized protein n=1 Tax=Candidatus Chisholmbacteria bacterium RIFCSPLOWO2_01_FULL_49_14 TaxID=1797593 RepID=A0A1G1VZQ7_9BACT|nr:MAG: hypothetical protein A3A65_02830 [Candidatus Chisholmbacteria bacterium RIFCSPLOWO2_01_FULL_49_14]